MMLDRLQVADLKDEIVSMQTDLNTVLYENQQQTQEVTPTIKTEPICQTTKNNQAPSQQRQQFLPSMQEPSQILKAKQEQKLFESIKNERIKVENAEKEVRKISPASPPLPSILPQQQITVATKAMSKFDKLKNDCNPQPQSSPGKQQPSTMKLISELKDELDDFDIESEIRSNFIMKKCEPTISTISPSPSTGSSSKKAKTREREFSPFSDYLNSVKMDLVPSKTGNKTSEGVKNEDGAYDEWLSIQKELSLDLDSKRKENVDEKKTTKALESDLSDIFDHSSPKSVEKQLDDLFSTSGTADSPAELNELFNESSTINEKTVENRLEALFGHDDQMKNSQQDLVETRLEQLFQGSVNSNDESALDSASFLYKNPDLTYEMIQKQVSATASVTTVINNNNNNNANVTASTSNKRQWTSSNSCDIFSSSNSSIVFPSSSSPTSSKRACTTTQSVAFDENKWIDDSFDFGSDINIPTETSNDGLKHREWNGGMDHNNDTIMGNQQFQANLQQQPQIPMNSMISEMDTSQIPPLNYEDDVDDISRQVQNAIDSILNLQSSDPLHYQLDSSFLELNAITSSSPNSPVNHVQHHPQNIQSNQQHHNQYPSIQQQPQAHQFAIQNAKMMTNSTGGNTKQQQQRKFSRIEDIGDCLIGGSNLDDSPSALSLTLTDSHGDANSSASVGEFVNNLNLLNCDEKSISTS